MNVDVRGPAGLIEAVLEEPRTAGSGGAAVVCHPHPLFGGTLQNKVAYRLARGLATAGMVVARFNFRGVGRSQGHHDDGVGEVDDLRAVVSWLLQARPGARLVLAGYSFGAHVASQLLVEDARAEALLAVGPALRVASFAHLGRCQKPKHFVVAEHDEFGELAMARPILEALPEPRVVHVVAGATHSFEGHRHRVEELATAFGQSLPASS